MKRNADDRIDKGPTKKKKKTGQQSETKNEKQIELSSEKQSEKQLSFLDTKVLNVYKPISTTPYQLIQQLKARYPQLDKDENNEARKIGYAGRLDPMAHGVLLLLLDEENKNRKKYEFLSKSYQFQLLLGLETDTYDLLGLVPQSKTSFSDLNLSESELEQKTRELFAKEFLGEKNQKYPPYSSARVNGKPMYYWSRENKIHEIDAPAKKICIFKIELEKIERIFMKDLYILAVERISRVVGDFRQKAIMDRWGEVLAWGEDFSFYLLVLKMEVSHGAYVRSVGNELGSMLGCGGVVVDLLRCRVGDYCLDDAFKLD
eukprot:TRINITY_DN4619_c0_g1_i1.p1 TRINITY_DN4619_c0_g1~~TRINITY_DN4619_c0_g1_i1.p1  ORF type:complete len:317 (-),score=51.71 TRINITY_DN4619_c0_g1_i1:42-992(-)